MAAHFPDWLNIPELSGEADFGFAGTSTGIQALAHDPTSAHSHTYIFFGGGKAGGSP